MILDLPKKKKKKKIIHAFILSFYILKVEALSHNMFYHKQTFDRQLRV